MALTRERFQAGMTTAQYIEQIKVNKDPFVEIYQSVQIPPDAAAWLRGLDAPVNLAVFTADWCGDALSTTPVILRLADSAPDAVNLQVFNRDDDVPLADTFLPANRAGTVPIFVVLDGEMNEVARFIETANALVPQIDAMDEAINNEPVSGDADDAAVRQARRGRRTAHRVAHAQAWAEVILQEFRETVDAGRQAPPAQRPVSGGTQWPP